MVGRIEVGPLGQMSPVRDRSVPLADRRSVTRRVPDLHERLGQIRAAVQRPRGRSPEATARQYLVEKVQFRGSIESLRLAIRKRLKRHGAAGDELG
jgi:hypothetical protein